MSFIRTFVPRPGDIARVRSELERKTSTSSTSTTETGNAHEEAYIRKYLPKIPFHIPRNFPQGQTLVMFVLHGVSSRSRSEDVKIEAATILSIAGR